MLFHKVSSRLSRSYYVSEDGRWHVYKSGRWWIRARVENKVALWSARHRTRREAIQFFGPEARGA